MQSKTSVIQKLLRDCSMDKFSKYHLDSLGLLRPNKRNTTVLFSILSIDVSFCGTTWVPEEWQLAGFEGWHCPVAGWLPPQGGERGALGVRAREVPLAQRWQLGAQGIRAMDGPGAQISRWVLNH